MAFALAMPKWAMPEPTANAHPATTLDVAQQSVVASLYRAAVGPLHADYYLRVFARLEAADRPGPSWNWAACLCTLNWLAFRQLWWAALAYVAIVAVTVFLLAGLGRLVFQMSDTQLLWLLAAVCAASFLVPGMWGNALFHAQCRKRTGEALAACATVSDAGVMLNRQASSAQRLAWLALGNAVLAGAAVGVWIAFPLTHRSDTRAAPVTVPAAAAPLGLNAPASVASMSGSMAAPPAMPASALARPAPAASAPLPAPTATGPATTQRFHVNAGLFALDSNASNAHAKLLGAGLTAFTQEIHTANGKRTRVRVGPFDTRADADSAARKIRALNLDALVSAQ